MSEWIRYDGTNKPTTRCRIRRGEWESVAFRAPYAWRWSPDVTHFMLKKGTKSSRLKGSAKRITMGDKYVTASGASVHILSVGGDDPYPVSGRVDGVNSVVHWTIDGRVSSGFRPLNIVKAPEKSGRSADKISGCIQYVSLADKPRVRSCRYI